MRRFNRRIEDHEWCSRKPVIRIEEPLAGDVREHRGAEAYGEVAGDRKCMTDAIFDVSALYR